MSLDPQGLPELQEWVVGDDGYHLQGFMSANVRVAEAVALTDLYWPRFVEYRGCAFLAFKYDRSGVDVWFDHLSGDTVAIEAVVNHVHLWDHFTMTSEAERGALPELARRIAVIWRAAAQAALPHLECEVRVTDGSDDYGPTLTLVSARAQHG